MKAGRPYLTERLCGECIRPLEITEERQADGWLKAVYSCSHCGARTVVTFSPQELAEWERRGRTRAAGAGL